MQVFFLLVNHLLNRWETNISIKRLFLSLSNKPFEWVLEIRNSKTLTTLLIILINRSIFEWFIRSQALKFKIDFKFSHIFKFNFNVFIAYFKDEIKYFAFV
jgi:hypothetical protein